MRMWSLTPSIVNINHVNVWRDFLMWDLIKDLVRFMSARKKFWLAPILIVLLLLGGLIVLSQGSAVAPFIYTLF